MNLRLEAFSNILCIRTLSLTICFLLSALAHCPTWFNNMAIEKSLCRTTNTAICQSSTWAIQVLCSSNANFHFYSYFFFYGEKKKTETFFFQNICPTHRRLDAFSLNAPSFFTKLCCCLVIFPRLNHYALRAGRVGDEMVRLHRLSPTLCLFDAVAGYAYGITWTLWYAEIGFRSTQKKELTIITRRD